MLKKLTSPVLLLLLIFSVGCVLKEESPVESFNEAANLVRSGDIVVVNTINDSVILLDANGTFKTTLVTESDSALVFIGGVAYDTVGKRLLYTYDHGTAILDAVRSIDPYNARVETVLNDGNLTGAMQGVARLTDGSYIVLESTTVAEKFNSNGVRQGAPFPLTIPANSQIQKRANGGFLVCGTVTTATNTVRTYTAAGVLVNSATSASPTPSLGALQASGCVERPDGTIVVAYSGTPDTVRAYSANLGTILWDFSDTIRLTTPGRMAVRANGNVLVTDTALNHIVEISSSGAFVRLIDNGTLATPGYIEVIP